MNNLLNLSIYFINFDYLSLMNIEENIKSESNILFKPQPCMDQDDHVESNNQDIVNQYQRPVDFMNNSRSILTKSSMMTYGKM